MQVFYKFLFLASLLALVAAAPAVSLEDGTSLTLQRRVLRVPLMPAGCMATAVTPVANGCVDRRNSDSAFTPDACF